MHCAPVWVWASLWGLVSAVSQSAAGTLPDDALGTPPVLAMVAYHFHTAATGSDSPSFIQQSTLSRITPDTAKTSLATPDGIQGVLHDNWFPRFGDAPDYTWLIYLRCTDTAATEKLRLALTTNVSAAVVQRPGDTPCLANIEAELTRQAPTLPMFWSTESPGVFDILATNSTVSMAYPMYVFVAIWDTALWAEEPLLHFPTAHALDQDNRMFVGTSFLIYAACGVVGTLVIGLIGYLSRRCWIHRHAHQRQLADHPTLMYNGEPFLSPYKPGIDPSVLATFPLRQYGALEKGTHERQPGQGPMAPIPPPSLIRRKSDIGGSPSQYHLRATSHLVSSFPPLRPQSAVGSQNLAGLVNHNPDTAIIPGFANFPTGQACHCCPDADVADVGATELCAICLSDFCAGDKVRVLPCHHQYHPLCIDPWLLNVSSLCPLCKENLSAIPCASASLTSAAATTTSPSMQTPVLWPQGQVGNGGSFQVPPRRHSLYHTYQTHPAQSTRLAYVPLHRQMIALHFPHRSWQRLHRFWWRRRDRSSISPTTLNATEEAG